MTEVSLMQQARIAIREDRLVDARRLLRQAIHEDPTNHAAWLLLARATPDEKLAAEYIERARLLHPDSPLVKRAGDDLASGRHASPPRTRFSWRLALPLIGVALILGLLAGKVAGQDAWQQLFALQDNGAELVLAAAESTQDEPTTASQSDSKTISVAAAVEKAESPVKSAPAASLQAIAEAEAPDDEADGGEDTIFQPVAIAGSDEALPDAIIKGIEMSVFSSDEEAVVSDNETSATSSTEQDVVSDNETSADSPEEEAANEEDTVTEAASEPEIVEEGDADEAAETAVDDEAAEVEEVESETSAEEEPASYDTAVPAAGEQWIDVNLTTQMLTAYEGETPVLYSAISSGLWQFPTVTGEFRTWMKYESQDMTGYHLGYNYELEDVPHVMYFFEDFAIHGAYWHNSFGTPMSHGCVNMNLYDAEWLYDWAPLGTHVSVHH